MRRTLIGLALFVYAALASAAEGSSYSLDVDLSPAGKPGAYQCKVVVKDLDTGKVLSAPTIGLSADNPASTRTTDGDLVAELKVSVDSKASRATAELKVSRGGRPVAAQKTSIAIR
jgi:hypothetical protein